MFILSLCVRLPRIPCYAHGRFVLFNLVTIFSELQRQGICIFTISSSSEGWFLMLYVLFQSSVVHVAASHVGHVRTCHVFDNPYYSFLVDGGLLKTVFQLSDSCLASACLFCSFKLQRTSQRIGQFVRMNPELAWFHNPESTPLFASVVQLGVVHVFVSHHTSVPMFHQPVIVLLLLVAQSLPNIRSDQY